MKSPIRYSKTSAPATVVKNPPKLALANAAYKASGKKTISKDLSSGKSSDQQAVGKKK